MEDLLKAILCFGALFGIYILGNIMKEKEESKKTSEYKEKGLTYVKEYTGVNYCGGFGDIEPKKYNDVILLKDRIQIFRKDILIKNIQDCSIQTETQLAERVSMGKLLCFGVFAFGMKGKTKSISKNYVVIRCNHRNKDIDLVLDFGKENEEFVRQVRLLLK